MDIKFTNEDAIQFYVEKMAFKVWHRLVFFVASLAMGFWFLGPVFFGDELPLWVIPVVFGPLVIWLAVSLPRHFVTLKDLNRRGARPKRFLLIKYTYVALKPTKVECAEHPWLLPLFYASLAIPVVCFIITFVTFAM